MQSNYKTLGSVLLIVIAVAGLSGCGDDAGDGDASGGTGGAGGSGGAGGAGGTGSGGTSGAGGSGGTAGGGSGGTAGGGSGGTGGAPALTEAECVTMTQAAMPMVPATCAPCLCGVDTAVGTCNANCWTLIACGSTACGDLPDAERRTCVGMMCSEQISAQGAATGARELGAALMTCAAECGAGGDDDAGL